jgi:hypothetical protein
MPELPGGEKSARTLRSLIKEALNGPDGIIYIPAGTYTLTSTIPLSEPPPRERRGDP